MSITLDISRSEFAAVGATAADIATAMLATELYLLTTTTNCYVQQGQALTLTCLAKASLVDGETFTLTVDGVAKTYELDVNGTGVTSGRVQVDISTDTTAAQVAARVKTAIEATQARVTVVDPTDGTLKLTVVSGTLTHADTVANASWAAVLLAMSPAAADDSVVVPAGTSLVLNGKHGPQVGAVRVTADGVATVAPILKA